MHCGEINKVKRSCGARLCELTSRDMFCWLANNSHLKEQHSSRYPIELGRDSGKRNVQMVNHSSGRHPE